MILEKGVEGKIIFLEGNNVRSLKCVFLGVFEDFLVCKTDVGKVHYVNKLFVIKFERDGFV